MGGAGVYLCRDCADELMNIDFKMKNGAKSSVFLQCICDLSGRYRAGKTIAVFEIRNQSVSNNSLGVISNFLQRKIIFS